MNYLQRLGINEINSGAYCGNWIQNTSGEILTSYSPIDGREIASVRMANEADYEEVMNKSEETFLKWRSYPAPKRGEIVRQIGNELRIYKNDLAELITREMGKIYSEAQGEVQEMIDMADFAVGLSRQLYGLSMHSERAMHRMIEQYHPLGIVGIISAFNFPAAVWAWNAMIAAICGDTMVWKPSSKTPLTAIAIQNIVNRVLTENSWTGVMNLIIGSGKSVGERMVKDTRIPLISATGSTKMGKRIGAIVGERLGRTILELGGNNGIIIMDDANIDLTLHAVLFGAIGTAGQRCTSTRRLIINKKISNKFTERLINLYKQLKIGNPMEQSSLMGPLVDKSAVDDMTKAINIARHEGGEVLIGSNPIDSLEGGCYVTPSIVWANRNMTIVKEETFAPVLYVLEANDVDEAIEIHNDVPQGLSSSIFTQNLAYSEKFLSTSGSDCGIANVNIGTSGAEIGGAFGGEKETGGGREAGSDSWKVYMRRQTNTINWGGEFTLAQGIKFEI